MKSPAVPALHPASDADAPDWPESFVQRYRAAGYWGERTFAEALAAQAARTPRRIALCEGDRQLTYAGLLDRCRRLAAGLRHHGLRAGDNVVVHLPNGIAFVEVCFALFQLGVRPVLALPAHRQHEIEGFCRFAEASAYLTAERLDDFDPRPLARCLLESGACPRAFVVGEAEAPLQALAPLYDAPPLEDCVPEAADIACFQLSGGTTGTPKLIPRRHREYLYNATASARLCGLDEQTVYLAGLPMAHNFTLCCPGVVGTLLSGGRVVVAPRPDPDSCFPLIARERVSHVALVPPLAMLWLDAQAERQADLSSLRLLQVGGSRLGSSAAQRVLPVLGCRLQQVLGMAEGLLCYTRLDDPPDVVLHTQGRPLCADDEVRVVDDDGQPVADGEVGELQVRGPYTIRGYYRLPAHNATAFTADGFYRTGDRVRRSADGYLVVEGRDKDQINRGGEKVAAEEVENLLIDHPQVHDATVVAMPDPLLGERTCAFVIPRDPPPSSLALKRYLHDRGLAAFKVPDRIELVPAFPQTGIGKISKKALREQLRRGLEARP
ncbi:(2,3-dihydroxybenzoyl)adenylate synthase [Pseudomonas mangiferae]|uniref:Pyochelin synthase PchD n=1 Tax=Pseudomonas mangiferae TaxID=2593654 RepID=A0A553GYC6_9PSED|nr:AMP-binding protein [Pseudomonas mangiferae]TRX74490.1 AMP-binding protein [Pseudomonas mangiferae]